jgi:diguanylate cyclase (GGDEF)-like protein
MTGTAACTVAAGVALNWARSPGEGTGIELLHTRVFLLMLSLGGICAIAVAIVAGKMLRPLHQIRQSMLNVMAGQYDVAPKIAPFGREMVQLDDAFRQMVGSLRDKHAVGDDAKLVLAARTQTVDRLLEFSQTIQGAGRPDQVFQTLSYFLQQELSLAGLMVLAVEPGATPSTQVKASYPTDLNVSERIIADIDSTVCPCLRQNLPRLFACEKSPIRCAIDSVLALPPAHPAYCIPFNIRKSQCVAHMLLPIGQTWTEDRRQLAQTYINTAHSALVSLNLLAEAEKQSMTDVLTGLYNRRSMESLLEREVALAERHQHTLSIVMIDMDKFKEVNDTHGHAAGDYMLKSFADCVRITLRKTDLAFRYGGDEFCIALPQTPIEQAQQVVQKLRQAYMSVDFSDAIAKLEHQPTLSIGVAERAKPSILTLQALLAAADTALYDAKNNNRNCIKLYTPPKAA